MSETDPYSQIVVATTLLSGGSELLGLLNKYYSKKINSSISGVFLDVAKFGWSLLSGEYFSQRRAEKEKRRADMLAEQMKQFYDELIKDNKIVNTDEEKEMAESLKAEYDTRVRELELRLGIKRPGNSSV